MRMTPWKNKVKNLLMIANKEVRAEQSPVMRIFPLHSCVERSIHKEWE
jgi:hypothetical protein